LTGSLALSSKKKLIPSHGSLSFSYRVDSDIVIWRGKIDDRPQWFGETTDVVSLTIAVRFPERSSVRRGVMLPVVDTQLKAMHSLAEGA